MNAGEQFARIEGLGDVVVGAEFQTHDSVDVFTAGREHDDRRHVLGGAQTAQDLQTVFTGHHEVENQGVEMFAHPDAVHGGAVFAHEHLKTVFTEIAAQ